MDTPKFPHHRDCEALTGITLDHLPRDGLLGRVRRFAKGANVWQPDNAADRIYFLRKGRVVVATAKPHERPVALRAIEPEQPPERAPVRGPPRKTVLDRLSPRRCWATLPSRWTNFERYEATKNPALKWASGR